MTRIPSLIILCVLTALAARGADPTHTSYTRAQCQGSAMPYPAPEQIAEYPDSLTPVMINHVGRHGARFPASANHANTIGKALKEATAQGTITPLGKRLLALTDRVTALSANRWGALDSLGMAEQRGIASRMYAAYPMLFDSSSVTAISSYSPRCIMSMYEFTHQLARLNNHQDIYTASGRAFSPLLRFFDLNDEFRELIKSPEISDKVEQYASQTLTYKPLDRVLGEKFRYDDETDRYRIAMAEYSFLAGLSAMGLDIDTTPYLTTDEYNALWRVFNLRQYLMRTASTVSPLPAQISSPLLSDIISSFDEFLAGKNPAKVNLRFAHAETLMPLLSLMRLQGCYYLTNYFDTVGLHWKDFHVVPMAANLQLILFQAPSGTYYLRADLNEHPVPLIPNDSSVYTEWSRAREYLQRCLPLVY
ncbi:MAG: histidine-type phosphatase [Paramuribaculum sp.]|nr:histidine-type phosphatase [Paramuribaculum sp.]